jgi:haloalkane dehalogenase
MKKTAIGAVDPHPRRSVQVLDSEMSYVDVGHGQPIVFLHGNPTSSYLWRNIIPYTSDLGRCLAPDLIGMGRSGKSPGENYRFVDHARYLDAWFEALDLHSELILVLHDWGSGLGFYRAFRFPEHVKAICYMEAIALPRHWEDFGESRDNFRTLRSEKGEELVLDGNFFIEVVLPQGIIRKLSDEEMAAYREPFLERSARLPTLVWPRQMPVDGEPVDVAMIVENYGQWLAESAFPKLLVLGEPGRIITGRTREFCRSWPNQREITVAGKHFLQEDSPHHIGAALREFVRAVRTS